MEEKNSPNRAIGHVIRRMQQDFNRCFIKEGIAAGIDEATQMNGWIMAYLYFHKDQPVYQKTIESTFGVNRSTVTSIVKLMEKKGYIERENVPGDARLKKLILTPLGEEMHFKTKQTLDSLELQIRKDLTKEEIETFFNVSDKIRKNLGEKDECIHKRIKD